jgi:tetratricopeptide (TPR) repeat protein
LKAAAPHASRVSVWLGALVLAVAVVVAYANSLNGAFVFDDAPSIAGNPTIRHLGLAALVPPAGQGITVDGRPLLNASLALNYALGGTSVTGYHVFNFLIHLAAALTLFGLIRRTLSGGDGMPQNQRGTHRLETDATLISITIALLWAVHPLQTESVTYIIQRAESLMGLFYLLTLYCFVRATSVSSLSTSIPPRPVKTRWLTASVLACLAGAATKEVTASAPLIVLLYDRAFVAGSFAAAWRARRGYYLTLTFATWGLLAFLVLGTGSRGGTAGLDINVTWWAYALTQFQAICHYLWLSVWPQPLIFDYGTVWVKDAADVVPYALVLVPLVAATLYALVRRPGWGFLGLAFFCILAPTSLIPGNRQTLAEHRMYLPLAVVLTLLVLGLHRLLTARRAPALGVKPSLVAPERIMLAAATIVAVLFIVLTVRRNADYRTELGLYRDTVAKAPDNAFARYNLGKALAEAGAPAEALPHYEAAARLESAWPHVAYNLGNALFELGRFAEASTAFQRAVQLKPDYVRAHYNLGNTRVQLGQPVAALDAYRAALRLQPIFPEARDNLGSVLLELRQPADAIEQYTQVVAAGAATAGTYCNLGTAYLLLNRPAEAIPPFEAALRLDPRFTVARDRLAQARALAAGAKR